MNGNNIIYFDSFGVGHIPKEIEKFIGNKNANVSRIQAYDSIMCGYYSTGLIDFILKANNLVNYTNYSLLMILRRMINNAKILSITKKIKKNYIALFAVSTLNSTNLKSHTSYKKTLVLSIICRKCISEEEKIFKAEESI